jgi:formylglycine-generating enzyme required for sulfatase activity
MPRHDVWRTLAIGLICFIVGCVVLFITNPVPSAEQLKAQEEKEQKRLEQQQKKEQQSDDGAQPLPKDEPQKKKLIEATQLSPDGATLRMINAGPFRVGDDPNSAPLTLGAFYIDEHEVTVSSFRACVEAGECQPIQFVSYSGSAPACNYGHPDRNDHPINCVSPQGAQQFCQWRSNNNDGALRYRLPTHDEWEKSARGSGGLKFPWGNQAADCNTGQFGGQCNQTGTARVGAFDRDLSPFHIQDVAGNVSEWVIDIYRARDLDPHAIARAGFAARGGNWRMPPGAVQSLGSLVLPEAPRASETVGLRCVGL